MWLLNHRTTLGEIATESLSSLLTMIPEDSWRADTRPKNNTRFQNTNTLWFKTSPLSNDQNFYTFDCNQHLNQMLLAEYQNLMVNLLTIMPGQIIKSGILRIHPRQSILKHIDGEHELHKFCHRIMIPFNHSDQIQLFFTVIDQQQRCYDILDSYEKNTVYALNSFLPHWVNNVSDQYYYCYVGDIYPDSLGSYIKVHHYGRYDRQRFNSLAIDDNQILTNGLPRWAEIYQQQKLFWANWKSPGV